MDIYRNSLTPKCYINKQYYCVDLCRFICSLLVVSIHVEPLRSYSKLVNFGVVNCLARIAVPFFFVVSGYFLFLKTSYINFDSQIPLKYVKRILKLYIIWTGIYSPLMVYSILKSEQGIIFGLVDWIRRIIFMGGYKHLWYLNAMIISTLILTFLLSKKTKIKNILLIAMVLYCVGLLTQSYFVFLEPLKQFEGVWSFLKLIQKIITTARNGIFEGFLFMGIGMLFAYKPIVIKIKAAILGFIVSIFLLFIEVMMVNYLEWAREKDLYICLVPTVFFMFYIASHIELKKVRHINILEN